MRQKPCLTVLARLVFTSLALASLAFANFALVRPALADPPEIVSATATDRAGGWTFSVTLRHADTGWDDYADGWEVLAPDGTRLGYRELLHPHVNEQPFTRSLSGVTVPEDLTQVLIRARDSLGGWDTETYPLDLPDRAQP